MVLKEQNKLIDKDDGATDTYWSIKFEVQDIIEHLQNSEYEFPEDFRDDPIGCGCGVDYGKWGDTIFNPTEPFYYHHYENGIDGVMLPTWLCICFSESNCLEKFGTN
eukprot:CAMPEP_0114578808 /NCGR_PEP_ID=MMETSP0125-20121206/3312_1 /TAXON_ID=485358 ORGANISM="Aristerostoma sp., Strain ATCC 50986" /NCGR_SAMPLE_ID=MMETSP0125 /ASSEMBLY_ACC=CAM_ASM_000245 /LENGTH=106 /DNA_ID=CAMNT_0001769177 /DNA_START=378 /DNA_END=698 /DNA_ORIENTATION=+